MKTIEEQIIDNRAQLDIETPPDGAWDEIVKNWKSNERPHNSFGWWKIAATVFFISSLGLLVYSLSLRQEVNKLASLGDISPEYHDVEVSYQGEIAQLMSSLSYDEIQKNNEYEWIIDEMKILDKINEQYRKDIGENVDQELLVRALMDYYEKKIRLLKKLELEINRQKNEKNNTTGYSTI